MVCNVTVWHKLKVETSETCSSLTNKRNNLLQIQICETPAAISARRQSWNQLNNKNNDPPIVYDSNTFKAIGANLHVDARLRILPFEAIKNIKQLQLNNKKRRSRRLDTWQVFKLTGVNNTNLIKVKKNNSIHANNTIFRTSNVQSIKTKELQVSELLSDHSLDFIVLTETWLTTNHNELTTNQWIDSPTLNRQIQNLHPQQK